MVAALLELTLSLDDCRALLRSSDIGRLTVSIHGQPFIFPVNYFVFGDSVVFRTDEGAKLDGVYRSQSVAFEVDGTDPEGETAWSVIVTGRAAPVVDPDRAEVLEVRSPSHWDPELRPYLIEIQPDEITGRIVALTQGVI